MATTPPTCPHKSKRSSWAGGIHFKQEDTTPFILPRRTWRVFAHARKTHDAKEKIDLNPQITDAVNGEVKIQFTDEQTIVLMGGKYGWDLVLESPDGVRLGPYFEGELQVKEIYTHS
jgi:hypothetical protein